MQAERLTHQQDRKDADGGCGCQCFGDLLTEGVMLSMICALQWALLGDRSITALSSLVVCAAVADCFEATARHDVGLVRHPELHGSACCRLVDDLTSIDMGKSRTCTDAQV